MPALQESSQGHFRHVFRPQVSFGQVPAAVQHIDKGVKPAAVVKPRDGAAVSVCALPHAGAFRGRTCLTACCPTIHAGSPGLVQAILCPTFSSFLAGGSL